MVRRAAGIGLIGMGVLGIGAGTLYRLEEYAFGGAIFWWVVMAGLVAVGLGLVILGRRRPAVSTFGAVTCALSLVLLVRWEIHVGHLGAWLWLCGIPGLAGFGVGIGHALLTWRRQSQS
jgi:hypothetical protein